MRNELRGEFERMADTHGKSIRDKVGLAGQDEINLDFKAYVDAEQRFLNGKRGAKKTVYVVFFEGMINEVQVVHGRVDQDFDTREAAEAIAGAVLEQMMDESKNDMNTIMALVNAYHAQTGKDVLH